MNRDPFCVPGTFIPQQARTRTQGHWYPVNSVFDGHENLQHPVRGGKSPARVTTGARILLKTDNGSPATTVAEALHPAEGAVFRTKGRFAQDELEHALADRTILPPPINHPQLWRIAS